MTDMSLKAIRGRSEIDWRSHTPLLRDAHRLLTTAEALREALMALADDAENHMDGDDRSLTLDQTCRRARAALRIADGEKHE